MIRIGLNIANRFTGGGTAVVVPVATAATSVGATSFTANWNAFSGANYYLLDVSLSSSFSTFVLQDTVVLTTSYNVTGLTSNTTYYYRVRAVTGSDSDAMAFVSRVYTAGGALSYNEVNATNQLVLDLKSYSIWTKMKAIYPMVGSSAAACAQNLVSSSFTGTFNGGWTYASTGVTPNGTSGYMDTGLTPNGNLSQNDAHASVYSRTNNNAGYQIDLGCGNSGGSNQDFYLSAGYGGGGVISNINGSGFGSFGSNTTTLGFFLSQRTSSSLTTIYQNNSQIHSHTQSSTTPTNSPIYLGRNTVSEYSLRQLAFASFGSSFSSTDRGNFYTAVNSFQVSLSRNV